MFGSIMPTPLAMPTTRAAVPATVDSAILTLVSVVMMPRGGAVDRRVVRHRRKGGDAGEHAFERVGPADHAGRRDQHVVGTTTEARRDRLHDRCVRRVAGRSVGHVGVLGHDDDRLGPAVAEVAPAGDHARPGEAAAREQPGRRHRRRRRHDHEVVGGVLHPDVADEGGEAGRQRGHGVRGATSDSGRRARRGWSKRSVPIATTSARSSRSITYRRTLARWSGYAVSSLARPSVGQHGEHHPTVEVGRHALDQAALHETVEPTGQPAGGELQLLGQVAHAHRLLVGPRRGTRAPGSRRSSGRGRTAPSRAPPSGR